MGTSLKVFTWANQVNNQPNGKQIKNPSTMMLLCSVLSVIGVANASSVTVDAGTSGLDTLAGKYVSNKSHTKAWDSNSKVFLVNEHDSVIDIVYKIHGLRHTMLTIQCGSMCFRTMC